MFATLILEDGPSIDMRTFDSIADAYDNLKSAASWIEPSSQIRLMATDDEFPEPELEQTPVPKCTSRCYPATRTRGHSKSCQDNRDRHAAEQAARQAERPAPQSAPQPAEHGPDLATLNWTEIGRAESYYGRDAAASRLRTLSMLGRYAEQINTRPEHLGERGFIFDGDALLAELL